ncbi:hypothetical protein M8J76_007734 [Diaphorina citri]|nr:hypothetical protein M8J76_007734 [Diaphorina citri]KAI5735631.1 hypothetical protein M8J77_020780 [Diaphorina citri]
MSDEESNSSKRKRDETSWPDNKHMKLIDDPETGWHEVEDLAVAVVGNLSGDFDDNFTEGLGAQLNSNAFNLNDALLGLSSLTVFKQETTSPNQAHPQNENSHSLSAEDVGVYGECTPYHGSDTNSTHLEELTSLYPRSHSSEVTSTSSPVQHSTGIEYNEFEYVLGAATSIATKVSEPSLTYLNQGQSYELKLKQDCGVKCLLMSVIRVSFHDRRLQYTEREQMCVWRAAHPGHRILEVDLPLSYGIHDVLQDSATVNSVQFNWDPNKETGVYIKVNCISTEFTPKKHGGEKGVPFRIQVDTFVQDTTHRHLHSASCQVKVFKLKGADRKHKQDKEKIMKRPLGEQEKYQPSSEHTVFTKIQYGADNPPPTTSSPPLQVNASDTTGCHESNDVQLTPITSQDETLKIQDGDASDYQDGMLPLKREFSTSQVQAWLKARDFAAYMVTFANYNGVDMIRLSREDLKTLCGLSEGIRLFNSIHPELLAHKRTIYLLVDSTSMVYHPIFLYRLTSLEMYTKLMRVLGINQAQPSDFYIQGPNNIHVVVTDELVNHIKDESMFSVDIVQDMNGSEHYKLVLKPIGCQAPPG